MTKKYRSATDIWMLMLIVLPLAYPIYEGIITKDLVLILTFVGIILFILSFLMMISYSITDDSLIISSGLFGKQKIAISDITSIRKTNNPLSAPAMSINRLEIKYGNKFDYALISPVRRQEFVDELLKVNPNITVEL